MSGHDHPEQAVTFKRNGWSRWAGICTGQAVEVVAMTMAVYLTISLVISLLMNIYNRAVAIKER